MPVEAGSEITLAGENGANPGLKTHSRSAVLILFLLLCQCLRYASVRIEKGNSLVLITLHVLLTDRPTIQIY